MHFHHFAKTSIRLRLFLPSILCLILGGTSGFGAIVPLENPFGIDEIRNAKLLRALELLKAGKLEDALATTTQFLKANPRSAPGHEIHGIVLVLQGKVDAGLAELEAAVAIDPNQSTAFTKIGDIYLSRGDRAKAKGYFLQTIALNPKDRHAHQRLGLLFEAENELPEAISHFEQGLAGTPAGYIGIKTNLGDLYNQVGLHQKTVRLLTPVVKGDTANPTAHIVLGTALLGLNQPDKALESFERAEKFSDDPAQIALAFGIAYRRAGQLEKSESELRSALEADPKSTVAMVQMGETLAAMKRLPEARTYFTRAAADAATRILATNRMAEIYLSHGQTEEALELYQTLEDDEAASLATFVGLAKVYQATDRFEEAEKVLGKGTERFPDNAEAYRRLGMHLAMVRQYARANTALEQARTLSPADPRVRKALSLVAYRQGDLKQAITEAEDLLKLVPGSRADQFYLATLLEESGRNEEASAHYEQILDANPKEVPSLNNLAQLRLKSGDTEEAVELASRAVLLAPDNPMILDTHGWILYQSKDLQKALQSLEKAVASPAASPTHHYHLAVVYEQLGMKAKAVEQLDAALATKADFSGKLEALDLAKKLRQNP